MISTINRQLQNYEENLPDNSTVNIALDFRGQNVSEEQKNKIREGIDLSDNDIFFLE